MAAAAAGTRHASPVRVSLLSSSSDTGADCAPAPPQRTAGLVDAADSDEEEEDTAASFEIIELLDDDSDDSDVIELLDSESEDADDDGDVVLVASLPPPTSTAGSSRRQQQQQQQQQWQQPPPPRQPRHAVHIYVDGSHRPHATNRFAMAAGVWAAGGALKLARNLHGGVADSVRAELGAILAAMQHIQAGGLGAAFTARQAAAAQAAAAAAQAAGQSSAAVPAAPQTAAQPAAVEVHLLTDCQACCDMLGPGERVNAKYVALVARIRSLKAALPFRVRLFKVKGHSRGSDAHAVGNRAADRLARTCDAHQPLVLLPA